jgi:hypothetical protein
MHIVQVISLLKHHYIKEAPMGQDSLTTQEWEQKIGEQARSLRLHLNLQPR